ncbi:hypothetical protein [Streptomyces boninensis]|uniref:hypothetical protein n=1 Tax=Streptomyces boninensis TaxID=2039455 RepID=UPI003B20DA62
MYLLQDRIGLVVRVLLWVAHGLLLIALVRKLGSRGSSFVVVFGIVLASAAAVYVADLARDDLTLQQRGERVRAEVVKEWTDPTRGRAKRYTHYVLERSDGKQVRGPEMQTSSDQYDVGQILTVLEDPEGKLAPKTPGSADVTRETAGAGAFALVALGGIGWATWRGSMAARNVHKAASDDAPSNEAQEETLREALRTYPTDRRGYIKVFPEDYPGLTHQRAARIAWELGLRAEAAGNRGSWRFGETVVEEVPHD